MLARCFVLFVALGFAGSLGCSEEKAEQSDASIDEPDDGSADGSGGGDVLDGGDGSDATDGEQGGDQQVSIWSPSPGTSWQWQLTETIDTSIDASMYDIDLFEAPEKVIAELHVASRTVICYFSAGSREDWRPDADDFPAVAIGNKLDNWPGERWIDIRNQTVRDIMKSRLDLAAQKKCDGVEPDNVDGYTNDPGFDFTYSDQLDFNRFLAKEAHARGLSVGLKNDLDQVNDLVGDFDWALNEECFSYGECDMLAPFIDAGKAVFQVEYGDESLAESICPKAESLDFDTLIKKLELDAWRVSCR